MEEENRIENAEAFRMVKEAVDTYQCSGCTKCGNSNRSISWEERLQKMVAYTGV